MLSERDVPRHPVSFSPRERQHEVAASVFQQMAIKDIQLITIARWLAKNAVNAELKAQGRNPDLVEVCEIAEAAKAYLKEHREELIEQAIRLKPRLTTLS
jgi:hypothetical protein